MKVFSLSLERRKQRIHGMIKIYSEQAHLDRKGVYISDIDGNQSRGVRPTYSFELYLRGKKMTDGYKRLLEHLEFHLQARRGIFTTLKPHRGRLLIVWFS